MGQIFITNIRQYRYVGNVDIGSKVWYSRARADQKGWFGKRFPESVLAGVRESACPRDGASGGMLAYATWYDHAQERSEALRTYLRDMSHSTCGIPRTYLHRTYLHSGKRFPSNIPPGQTSGLGKRFPSDMLPLKLGLKLGPVGPTRPEGRADEKFQKSSRRNAKKFKPNSNFRSNFDEMSLQKFLSEIKPRPKIRATGTL